MKQTLLQENNQSVIYDPFYIVSKKSKSERRNFFPLDEDKLKMRRTNRTCYVVYCVKLKRKDAKGSKKRGSLGWYFQQGYIGTNTVKILIPRGYKNSVLLLLFLLLFEYIYEIKLTEIETTLKKEESKIQQQFLHTSAKKQIHRINSIPDLVSFIPRH